jgi:hypothetical protein
MDMQAEGEGINGAGTQGKESPPLAKTVPGILRVCACKLSLALGGRKKKHRLSKYVIKLWQ